MSISDHIAFARWIDAKTGERVADWPSVGGRVIRGIDANNVYDSETGRNFARDDCGNWIDTKTGKRVADWPSIGGRVVRGMERDRAYDPETGRNFVREPCVKQIASARQTGLRLGTSPYSLSFTTGADFLHYSSSYRSTGTQAPLDASSNSTGALICGGVNGYWPMPGIMPSGYAGTYGGGVNLCGVAGGKSDLYRYVVHPAGGAVTATVDPGLRIEAYAGLHWDAFGPSAQNPYLFMRVGPVFAQNKISVSSDQTGAGGRFETASSTRWTTGLMLEAGLSSPLCRDCAFGKPLRWSISAKGYWFGSGPSVSVTSSAFGFTETASVSRSSEYSFNLGLGMSF